MGSVLGLLIADNPIVWGIKIGLEILLVSAIIVIIIGFVMLGFAIKKKHENKDDTGNDELITAAMVIGISAAIAIVLFLILHVLKKMEGK